LLRALIGLPLDRSALWLALKTRNKELTKWLHVHARLLLILQKVFDPGRLLILDCYLIGEFKILVLAFQVFPATF
jgi:hypothetical protein